MNDEKNYYKVLADLLNDLLKINPLEYDYINLILNTIKKYFQADHCMLLSSKNEIIQNLIFNDQNKKVKFINFDGVNKEETLIIINSKISSETEDFLVEKIKPVLYSLNCNNTLINSLKNEIYTDSLTNIANYNALQKLLVEQDNFGNVGVCFIDANGLGVINNLYGHDEGDKMLITIANIIKKYIRKTDVYKKGGDEFIIICENISEELFNSKIANIKKDLELTPYSASFGSVYSQKTNNILDLIGRADELMYLEKEKYRLENPDKYSIKR